MADTALEPIAWDVASRVARQALKISPQRLDAVDVERLQIDFSRVTTQALGIVEEMTGLHAPAGPPRAEVLDRADWVDANVSSFKALLEPVARRLMESNESKSAAMRTANRTIAGGEIGLVLSWMSSKVLGQYDLMQVKDGDVIYYVGPNIFNIELRHGFAPNEFRLWIALHEVTHHLQFSAVPWMREYFLDLVERGTSLASPDSETLLAALRRAANEIRQGHNPLAEGGVMGLLASADQLATLREAQALMSLLEGHGNAVMSSAARDLVPGAARFSQVLSERRKNARPVAKVVQQALGFEAKLRQYGEGEHFVRSVIETAGQSVFDSVWQSPQMLPSLDEIRDPNLWIERVGGLVHARG